MNSSKAEVTIIVVIYKAWPLVFRCLKALKNADIRGGRVILVDNNSQEDIPNKVQNRFPSVEVVALNHNLLYTAANNLILRQCKEGKYVVLLNPDVELCTDTLECLLDFMNIYEDVGICGPKLILENGSIDPACRRSKPTYIDVWAWILRLNRIFPSHKLLGHYNLTYLDSRAITDVDVVSGACMVIRRSIIDTVGVLDEQFAMYGSDIDFCIRVREAGWRVVYNPTAQALHTKRASTTYRQKWALVHFYDELILLCNRYIAVETAKPLNYLLTFALQVRKYAHLFGIIILPKLWK